MITLEIFEPDECNPYKTIYYRDDDDLAIRVTVVDQNNKIVTDELCELNHNKQVSSRTRYASDLVTVIAYRQHHFNKDTIHHHGFTDYKLKDGQLKMTCRCESIIVIPERLLKCHWYDENNRFVYCEYFTHEEPYGMIQGLNLYDIDGNILAFDKRHLDYF